MVNLKRTMFKKNHCYGDGVCVGVWGCANPGNNTTITTPGIVMALREDEE